jgi:L-ascorbate metabolism protein UlaG (beta-lactamase superfamily)
MLQPKFGKKPSGVRLQKIAQSPNYKNGAFQNLNHTPSLTEGASFYSVLKEFLFVKKERLKPKNIIPTIKTDLLKLKIQENVLIWFGHSSYFMQVDGKRILVDPVLSGAASPLSFTTKAFAGTDVYSTEDIPEIDYLFISHDHWDHLDYETIIKIKPKIKNIICGLGVGEHFEKWGFNPQNIIEQDWNESVILENGFIINTLPARHFSGRTFKRNTSLWLSFAFKTPNFNIYLGGDSGYDEHFSKIGKDFGPFDLAILENGQYDKSWKYIHMMPAEVLQAAKDLNTAMLFPVHSSKFALSNHQWDAPLKTITQANRSDTLKLITPKIGELVILKSEDQKFDFWWENID